MKNKRLAKKVMLIGWDAADWQMIDPLIEKGWMPNLKRLIEGGVRGNINTLFPVLSPMLWNSIATGKYADKHDILGFMEPDGQGGVRPVTSTSRKAKAMWNILSQNGLRSAVVGWFASAPAERINGCIVTDRYRDCHGEIASKTPLDERAVYPASLIPALEDLIVDKNNITAEQILAFIPDAQLIDHTKEVRLAAFAHGLAQCASIHNAATWLAENETWDLLAVYYDTIDHAGHGFMEFHPPQLPQVTDYEFKMYSNVMSRIVAYHDAMLARLLELAGDDTTVIILSDHGFRNDEHRPRLWWDAEQRKKVGPGQNPVAWHRPQGIFVAHGPGIKQGVTLTGASLLDIAPTVLTLFGLPVGLDMDGHALTQIMDPEPEVVWIDSWEPEAPNDGVWRGEEIEHDPWAAQEAMKQLIELGYMEDPGEDKEKAVRNCSKDRKMNLAQMYMSTHRTRDAIAILKEVVAEDPEARDPKARLAIAYRSVNKLDEAEKLLDGLKADDEESNVIFRLLRGSIMLAKGDAEGARAQFEEVLAERPRMPMVHLQIGAAYLKEKLWPEAEAAYRQALELEPENPEAHDRLGCALRGQKNWEDAAFHHMKAVSLQPNMPIAHLNLGIAMASLGRREWAEKAFITAMEQIPESPFPHTCLERLYTLNNIEPDKAAYHRQMAKELERNRNKAHVDETIERGEW